MWSSRLSFFVALHLLLRLVLAQNGGTLLIAEFQTADAKDRNDLVSRLLDISKVTSRNGDIPKYGILAPQVDDGKTLFTVEEYTSQAALDAHLASQPVQDLFSFLESIHVTPIVNLLDLLDGFHFAKSFPEGGTSPWVLVQEITYKSDAAIPQLLPSWRGVVSAAQREAGTLLFGVYTDPKNATKLFTVEAYQSFDYFSGTHAKGDALAEKDRKTGDLVSSLSGAALSLIGGFLWKR